MRRAIGAALALSLALGPGVAAAAPEGPLSDPEANAHFAEAQRLFVEVEDMEGAAREFKAAYEIEASPLILYGWATAEYNLGHCREAVKLFQQFIDSEGVPEAPKQDAKDSMAKCATELLAEPEEPEPVDEPIDDDPVDDTGTTPGPIVDDTPKDRSRKWYLDPVGDSLVAIGVVGVGTGVGLLIGATVLDNKPQAPSYAEHVARIDRVRTLQIAGAVTLGVGGALAIGGAVRWALVSKRSKAQAGLLWDGRGLVGLQVRGRF